MSPAKSRSWSIASGIFCLSSHLKTADLSDAGEHWSMLVAKDRIRGVMWVERGEQCMSLAVTDLPWRQLHLCISPMQRAAVVTPGVYYWWEKDEKPEKKRQERVKSSTLTVNILKALSEWNRIFPHHLRTSSGEHVIRSHPPPLLFTWRWRIVGLWTEIRRVLSCIIEENCMVHKEKC